LPPSPTFWRCPSCGNEARFLASGTARIECGQCGKTWSAEQLVEAHARVHSLAA
jgi:ribosomal protein S27E